MNKTYKKIIYFTSLIPLLVSPLASSIASAQDEGSETLDEITVTATYRSTKLMDTAAAITAMGDKFIEEMGAGDMSDLFQYVPGLNMTQAASGNARYVVRGVTSQTGESPLSITAAAVGLYLGEVPVTSSVGSSVQMNSTLFDIERVEVLKGPQGTLFGEGSQGGTIRYLFNKPDATAFDASATLGYSTMDESSDSGHRADFTINVPIIEGELAARLNVFDSSRPGWIDNFEPAEADFNDGSATGARGSFLWTPTDTISLEGSLYHVEQDSNGIQRSDQNYVNDSNRTPDNPPRSSDKFDVYNLVANIDMGFANLTSSTSYTEREMLFYHEYSKPLIALLDFVFSFNTAWGWPADGGTLHSILNRNRVITERFTQEFRLVSSAEDRFRYTTGVFFKDSDDLYDFYLQAAATPARPEFQPLLDSIFTPEDPTALVGTDGYKEWAAFVELSYDITDELELTVGGRYTDMKQTLQSDEGAEDTPFTPKVVVSWRPTNDLLVYGSFAEGFRQGNTNRLFGAFTEQRILDELNALPGPPPDREALLIAQLAVARANKTFDGDTLANYELGLKTPLFNDRASLAMSVYFIDWQNLIQEFKDPILIQQAPNDTYNANLGDAKAKGFELEFSMMLTDRLFWRFGGDMNDTEVKGGANAGNELIWAPKYSITTGIDYTFPVASSMEMTLHADAAMVDDQWVNGLNTLLVEGYSTGNVSVILRGTADTNWRASLFVRNVTNENYLSNFAQLQSDTFYTRPRSFGVEFSWDYN